MNVDIPNMKNESWLNNSIGKKADFGGFFLFFFLCNCKQTS